MVQIIESLLHWRQRLLNPIQSIALLLMFWWYKKPRHQEQWYQPSSFISWSHIQCKFRVSKQIPFWSDEIRSYHQVGDTSIWGDEFWQQGVKGCMMKRENRRRWKLHIHPMWDYLSCLESLCKSQERVIAQGLAYFGWIDIPCYLMWV